MVTSPLLQVFKGKALTTICLRPHILVLTNDAALKSLLVASQVALWHCMSVPLDAGTKCGGAEVVSGRAVSGHLPKTPQPPPMYMD